ncbi:ABC transporter substrate-binding protein [Pelagovum pacificum]|nr:ABC transporter substrate-binding protein [Pelagovum pacificum]QQA42922.1 ABC transporter substrate-binding protein [Pelagovum pacificum]
MKHIALAAFALLSAVPAAAQDTRTVTDHSGHEVTLPADPQRIVSLHDWTATVMAWELGANLIGSTGRVTSDGGYFVRSGRELYGLTFDDIALASVHGQIDVEQIAALQPDLIIGNLGDTLSLRDQLSAIAPTIIYDPANGQDALTNYAEFAGWVNRAETFDALQAAYDARIEELRPAIMPQGEAPTYVIILPDADDVQIRLFRTYGAQSQVLEDLGFEPLPVVDQVPEAAQETTISAELIRELDADWVFTSHIADRGEDDTTALTALEQIAPGSTDMLGAVTAGRFHSSDRFYVYPMTFAAMDYVLEEIEALVSAD